MTKSRTIQLVIAGKDRVSKMLKRITGGLKKWGVGALKITGGLVAGFGAVTIALGAMFSKLSDQIDEQAKMASALGLSNEQLGVMRDAAGYAGISVANLNTGLRKMSQSVADAADGTGEAKDALKDLGLDAKKLEKMGPEKAFKQIITKLDKIPNGIKKTQMAMDIFGRSGAAMANLTSKGLQQAQDDADTLGLKLSTAQAKGVEAANDSWARIKIVAGDFLKFVTAKIAPGIKKGFDQAFNFIKGQDLQKWGVKAAYGIAKAFQGTVVVLGAAGEAVIAMTRGLVQAFNITNKIIGGISAMRVSNASGKLADIKAEIARMEASPFSDFNQKAIERLRGEEVSAQGILDTYTKIADSSVKIDETLNNTSNFLSQAQGFSQSKESVAAISELEKLVDGFNKKQEETKTKSKESGAAVSAAADEMAKRFGLAADKAERIHDVLERLSGKTWDVNLKVNKYGGDIEGLAKDLDDEADK